MAYRFRVAMVALAISATMAYSTARSAERPNIIFLLTDDQRADTLGCMGNRVIETPHLDQLARDGVLFEKASVTSAICTPSRISYFLGQYERRHGVNFNSGTVVSEKAWRNSYPELVKRAGYYTGYVGKNHAPVGEGGYDSGRIEQTFDYWYAAHGHIGFYPKRQAKNPEVFHNAVAHTQVELLGEGVDNFLFPQQSFLKAAKRFLDERPRDRPFCLSVCFNVPHGSSTSRMEMLPSDPDLYRTKYRDQLEEISLSPNYVAKRDVVHPKLPRDVLQAHYRQTGYDYVDRPDEMLERKVRTYQTVTGVDRFVGNLRKRLTELGLAENTVLIFSSDHGIMQGEFGLGGKALNYERCLHVPMIVCDPRVPPSAKGQRRKELVQSIDVAPTILDLAGVDTCATMQGRSLTALIENQPTNWREYAFAENLWSNRFGNPRIESVRDQRWKYLRYFENDQSVYDRRLTGAALYVVTERQAIAYQNWRSATIEGEKPVYEELYDLENDPHETTNLIAVPAHAELLEKMRAKCQELVLAARGE